jgi:hypothetical protein
MLMVEAAMPATVLHFERRDRSPLTPFRPRALPTAQQIAHRWAMLSYLRRHVARPQPDRDVEGGLQAALPTSPESHPHRS